MTPMPDWGKAVPPKVLTWTRTWARNTDGGHCYACMGVSWTPQSCTLQSNGESNISAQARKSQWKDKWPASNMRDGMTELSCDNKPAYRHRVPQTQA